MGGMSAMEPHHMNGSLGGYPHPKTTPPTQPGVSCVTPPPTPKHPPDRGCGRILRSVSSICGQAGSVQGGGGGGDGEGDGRGWELGGHTHTHTVWGGSLTCCCRPCRLRGHGWAAKGEWGDPETLGAGTPPTMH